MPMQIMRPWKRLANILRGLPMDAPPTPAPNHDASIKILVDPENEQELGLLGRPAELQFVRLAEGLSRQKAKTISAVAALGSALAVVDQLRTELYHTKLYEGDLTTRDTAIRAAHASRVAFKHDDEIARLKAVLSVMQ